MSSEEYVTATTTKNYMDNVHRILWAYLAHLSDECMFCKKALKTQRNFDWARYQSKTYASYQSSMTIFLGALEQTLLGEKIGSPYIETYGKKRHDFKNCSIVRIHIVTYEFGTDLWF